jgi:hypothetical protein
LVVTMEIGKASLNPQTAVFSKNGLSWTGSSKLLKPSTDFWYSTSPLKLLYQGFMYTYI